MQMRFSRVMAGKGGKARALMQANEVKRNRGRKGREDLGSIGEGACSCSEG